MKLIANNFTGYLPSGERYKITLEDKLDEVLDQRFVMITKYHFDTSFDMWFNQKTVCSTCTSSN